MRLAGTPSHPSYPPERRQHLRAEQTQRQHRLRVRHVAEVHVEQEQLDADVLESGSGGDGSTVRQLSGKRTKMQSIRQVLPVNANGDAQEGQHRNGLKISNARLR